MCVAASLARYIVDDFMDRTFRALIVVGIQSSTWGTGEHPDFIAIATAAFWSLQLMLNQINNHQQDNLEAVVTVVSSSSDQTFSFS